MACFADRYRKLSEQESGSLRPRRKAKERGREERERKQPQVQGRSKRASARPPKKMRAALMRWTESLRKRMKR